MIKIKPQDYTILIVDDLKENIELLSALLRLNGYKTTFAKNGKQAIETVGNHKPDLILLDLMMPVMDGLQVCEILKSNLEYQDIPIIFLTANQDQDKLSQAFDLGASDYVMKPFQKTELLSRIKHQLVIKKQEAEIKQKNAELALINKELKLFDMMICHDLRNPLTHIKGFVYILKRNLGKKATQKIQVCLNYIDQGVNKITHIIDGLSLLSRIQNLENKHFQEVNLSLIAENILKKIDEENSDRQLKFTIKPELLVNGDSNLLEIALENLINNAWKYGDKKTITEIEFGTMEKQELITHKLNIKEEIFTNLKDDEIIYFIRDNGIGFDPKEADKIFDPFERLHSLSEFEGVGMGLAIVERIISYHKGKIWCDAKINQGATFCFTIG
jgi:two-component system, sensor histidine kinase and response regulator